MKTILLVEDDKMQLETLIHFLEDDFIIKIAYDGEAGYEAYIKHKPDIIISDINMPKMNGIDMVQKIRLEDASTKIIMLTSHNDLDYLLQATELKLVKYLLKPMSKEDLYIALDMANNEIKKYTITSNQHMQLSASCYWDAIQSELYCNDTKIKLSSYEICILTLLIEAKGNIVTHNDMLSALWDHNFSDSTKDSLKTLINRLRKKFPEEIIESIYGMGYKLNIAK